MLAGHAHLTRDASAFDQRQRAAPRIQQQSP